MVLDINHRDNAIRNDKLVRESAMNIEQFWCTNLSCLSLCSEILLEYVIQDKYIYI